MKRSIGETDFFENITMAKCLISLSRGPDVDPAPGNSSPGRVFECKTCNRQFPSFQALGGHRASHKKPKLNPPEDNQENAAAPGSPVKPKMHECSVCGLEFAIGQALGGHMRRHRVAVGADHHQDDPMSLTLLPTPLSKARQVGPVVKKSNSRRVLCLDLNLTPLENDLEFRLGKAPPPLIIDCFL